MKTSLTALALLSLSATAFAGPPTTTPAASPKPAAKAAGLICPVSGDKIASVKAAVGSSVYKGKTYYFCCDGCKPAFDKNPAKYIKTAAAKPAVPAKSAAKSAG